MPSIRLAQIDDVERTAPLFDAYRQFYGREANLELARWFLGERLSRGESTILIAIDDDGTVTGFVQLYPCFSSVRATRILILNDLYVVPAARRGGVGRQLLLAAAEHARSTGAQRLKLSTAITNLPAQRLYESLGWIRDTDYYEYNLAL